VQRNALLETLSSQQHELIRANAGVIVESVKPLVLKALVGATIADLAAAVEKLNGEKHGDTRRRRLETLRVTG
jgi:hypothetical protein